MANLDANAPRRTRDTCAKITLIGRIRHRLRLIWQRRNHPDVPYMNSHLARDIGLSDIELARRQHQWPSETTHHPRS